MADVSRTVRKLEEAHFFLERLRENNGKVKKFDWYLSAFISSARSVLWIMRNEYADVPGWKEWYADQKPTDPDLQALLDGTNEIRIRTEKREPLRSDPRFTVKGIRVPQEQVERFKAFLSEARDKKQSIAITGTAGENATVVMTVGDAKFSYPVTEIEVDRRLPEFPDANILDISERYYAALASVVAACDQKFANR